MRDDFYPVCVVTPVPTESGIRFLHPKGQYEVDDDTKEIWALLAECNGYQSVDMIIKKLGQLDPKLLADLFDDLRSAGVLIDSREYALHFHTLASNPAYYARNLTPDQIRAYTARPRLPVFAGPEYHLLPAETSLAKIAAARQSCRNFAEKQLSLQELSAVLRTSYAPDGVPTPSAGGLYPLKLYLLVTQPGDLPLGYYEFDPANNTLRLFDENLDRQRLEFALNSDDLLCGATNILVIAADLQRHLGKYSDRGYRYTLMEAGHAAQNVQLASAELGIGCLEYGGFQDEVLAAELGLVDAGIAPLIVLALGYKSEADRTNSAALLEKLKQALVGPRKPVRYARIRERDPDIPFFSAATLHRAHAQQDARLSLKLRFAGGTGTSDSAALVGAIAEAYERYASGLVRVDARMAANNISSRWLDPRKIAPLTSAQLHAKPHLGIFEPTAEYEWVLGTSLTDGSQVYVPIDLVFYPLFGSSLGRKLLCHANSSGVAAFTSVEGAQKRALLEAIERDALMRTWFTRVPPRRIATSVLSHQWRQRVEYWKAQGRDVHVLNISEYGVVVTCVVIVSEGMYPAFCCGASASASTIEESLAKAFHEAELLLFAMLKWQKPKPIKPQRVYVPIDHARLYAQPKFASQLRWLWSGEETPEIPRVATSISDLYGKLDAVAIPLSPADAPLVVVRVISEKLVPINFGLGTEYYTHPTLGHIHPDSLRLPHFFA